MENKGFGLWSMMSAGKVLLQSNLCGVSFVVCNPEVD